MMTYLMIFLVVYIFYVLIVIYVRAMSKVVDGGTKSEFTAKEARWSLIPGVAFIFFIKHAYRLFK